MTTLELYRKHKKGEIGRDRFLYEVRRDNNLPWITNITSYDDAVKILKNKGIIREAQFEPQNIATDPLVDRVNPYALKREVEKLLAKETELTNDSYKEALNKAAKKLTTPEAVKKAMFANADSVAKADAKLQTQPVKKNNLKDKANEMKKAKGQAMPKATAAPTKENKKAKKPKGVEVMKDKGVEGSEKVLRETALAELHSFLKKKLKLSEDTHPDYHVGMEVHLPGGDMGKIIEMIGSTCTVEKADGELQDLQLSALNYAKKQAMEAAEKGATVDEARTSDIKAGNKYHWGGKKVEIVSVEDNTIKARQVGDSQVFILRDPKNLKPIKEEKELGYEAGIKLADKLVDAIEMYNSLSDEEKEAEAKRLGTDVLAKLKAAHDDIMNRIHDESNYPPQEEDNLQEAAIQDGLQIGDRVKVVYANQFKDITGTVEDIVNGFVVVSIDGKPGTYSMHISDVEKIEQDLDEARDINDPSLVALRSRIQKQRTQQNRNQSLGTKDLEILRQIKALKMDRAQVMRDMEQEAEPEGGPIADDYADRLMDLDNQIKSLEARLHEEEMDEAQKFKAAGETIFKSDAEAPGYEADLKKAGVKYIKAPAK